MIYTDYKFLSIIFVPNIDQFKFRNDFKLEMRNEFVLYFGKENIMFAWKLVVLLVLLIMTVKLNKNKLSGHPCSYSGNFIFLVVLLSVYFFINCSFLIVCASVDYLVGHALTGYQSSKLSITQIILLKQK